MVKWINNNIPPADCSKYMSLMDIETVCRVRNFHRGFPQYSVTPLSSLESLSRRLGVGGIYVKDESHRFGLNSFKALGCTFAIASYIAQKLGCSVWDINYKNLPETAKRLGEFTFYTATDGNHGRAVAWSARQLGQKAVIYMNKGCPQIRLEHILREGAEAFISELNYDDTIRLVKDIAGNTPNSIIIQDTAWDGYEDIPAWIMQGYAVMALEACEQLANMDIRPTHLILQAGVGAFAGSAQALICNFYKKNAPVSFIVEPHVANCYYRSVEKGNGSPVSVGGEMKTVMAGLACGEPNPIAWDIIKNISDYFVSIDDCHAENAMRVLGNPLQGDPKIISGESGAAGMGFLLELLSNEELSNLKQQAGIDESSVILIFSTEGDTGGRFSCVKPM